MTTYIIEKISPTAPTIRTSFSKPSQAYAEYVHAVLTNSSARVNILTSVDGGEKRISRTRLEKDVLDANENLSTLRWLTVSQLDAIIVKDLPEDREA